MHYTWTYTSAQMAPVTFSSTKTITARGRVPAGWVPVGGDGCQGPRALKCYWRCMALPRHTFVVRSHQFCFKNFLFKEKLLTWKKHFVEPYKIEFAIFEWITLEKICRTQEVSMHQVHTPKPLSLPAQGGSADLQCGPLYFSTVIWYFTARCQ